MSYVKTYYFDSNAKEVFLGATLDKVEDAAYVTTDPNDVVFAKPPSNQIKVIENGEVKFVPRPYTRSELLTVNRNQRESVLMKGMAVKGNFMIDGAPVMGHTAKIHLSANIKTDVIGIGRRFERGYAKTVPLVLNHRTILLIGDVDQCHNLEDAGMDFSLSVYGLASENADWINSLDAESVKTAMPELRRRWAALSFEANLLAARS